jgi:hypothetical protein
VNPGALQTRFARAVEAEYGRRLVAYQAAGLSPEEAHLCALEDAKRLGREVLDELRRRGLFPWTGDEAGVAPFAAPVKGTGAAHVS